MTPIVVSSLYLLLAWIFFLPHGLRAAELKVKIHSPKDGSRVVQEQNTLLVNGKVAQQGERRPHVDIFFVLDVSGSTAHYAGVDLGDPDLPAPSGPLGLGRPQIGITGGGLVLGVPPKRDLRNSILAAEVAASKRLLLQLDSQTTRVGLITFGEDAKLVQPLTHDFELAKQALGKVFTLGPHGGTNMVEGIRLAIRELAGKGQSGWRGDAVKVQFLLTDGYPTLPIGGGKKAHPEDTNLAVNAARISGKAGIKIHVFALGEEALSHPTAAVGVAGESGGIFTPVTRPADILRVLDNISVVGVNYIQVFNETTGQKASLLRLAADGFFSSALPVAEGQNRIQVLARASDGGIGRDSVSIYYQRGDQRSLELEVFLDKERKLRSEVEKLGEGGQRP